MARERGQVGVGDFEMELGGLREERDRSFPKFIPSAVGQRQASRSAHSLTIEQGGKPVDDETPVVAAEIEFDGFEIGQHGVDAGRIHGEPGGAKHGGATGF